MVSRVTWRSHPFPPWNLSQPSWPCWEKFYGVKGTCLEVLRMRCHHDCHVVFRFIPVSPFFSVLAKWLIVVNMPRSLFSSEREKALILVYLKVFVGPSGMTLTTSELDDDFREFFRNEPNSLPLSLRNLLSTCSIPPLSLDTGKWLHCSKEISTNIYIRQHTSNMIEDFLTSTSSTKLNMHHVEFFFIFRALVCFHGVLGFPHAIPAVKGRAYECTQVFPVAISGVPVHAFTPVWMRP